MTDLREVFEDEDAHVAKTEDEEENGDASSDEEKAGEGSDVLKPRKRRKIDKAERELEGRPQRKGKYQIDTDPSFFSGL